MDLVSVVRGMNGWTASALLLALYALCLVVYRLLLSPVARYPGPKLTAICGWVETYYDVFKGGQFSSRINKWHEQYGPIIRITPNEVHISDPRFFDIAYSNTPFDKYDGFRERLGMPQAMAATPEHDLHRRRRVAVGLYFSKRQINSIAPLIQDHADKMCQRLLNEYKGTGKVLTVNEMYAAMATDVIMQYCFAWSYDFLDYPDFVSPFTTAISRSLLATVHVAYHFPWFRKLMQSLPESVVGSMNPVMVPMFQFKGKMEEHVENVKKGINGAGKDKNGYKTVIRELLDSDLPVSEKSVDRLRDEAIGIVGAAIDTTKTTLAFATFHILHNPRILKRLQTELQSNFPDPSKTPTLPELERLPYLTAIIQEALRHTHGLAQRMPRRSPSSPVYYGQHVIRPGTLFSASIPNTHRDPTIFPDPRTFVPDRWLNKPTVSLPLLPSSPSEARKGEAEKEDQAEMMERPLTHYLVAFSRGTRMCLGHHLAWAQLYIALATVFRKCELQLFETKPEDVELVRDFFVPIAREGSKGVRVVVV